MARLVLVDTADALPGLLPLHAWSALMGSELVVVGADDHPFLPHLQVAELRVEVIDAASGSLVGADLTAGDPARKVQAEAIVARARDEGEVTYLYGRDDDEAFTRTLGMEAAGAGVEVEVVYFTNRPPGSRVLDLVEVQARLLAPDGCPWDREQTHTSLARYAVEEVYELAEAIAAGDAGAMREELGDVLLQVVFHAQIATDFDIDDVAGGIVDKLVRRHPHVFGEGEAADASSVMANWEELKRAEKPDRQGLFDGVPTAQPALGYVGALQSRAARAGFEWASGREAGERVRAELDEVLDADDPETREREIGDLLMSVAGLARRLDIDPEQALRGAAGRFRRRVDAMVERANKPLEQLSRDEWLVLWDEAKRAVTS
jgi:XTP/dITP diphosphohydrolase